LFYHCFVTAKRDFSCGEFLRAARLRHNLDQADLARRVGMKQSAVSRIERDVVSPSLETLNRLMEGMGETLLLSSFGLSDPVPGGSNQSLREVLDDYRELTAEERLAQAAKLSEMATELAAGASDAAA
jgi:transcriptional regulator with XRE-family HTH domain